MATNNKARAVPYSWFLLVKSVDTVAELFFVCALMSMLESAINCSILDDLGTI